MTCNLVTLYDIIVSINMVILIQLYFTVVHNPRTSIELRMQDEGGKGFVLGDLAVNPLRSYHVK